MRTYVKIMVDESLPAGSFKVEPATEVVLTDGVETLVEALVHQHKVVWCSSRAAGESLRRVVEKTAGLEEIR